ncbi:hypothetical protein RND81_07G050900 [Saponaria officinalis]|uniref:Retrovirus-related Pol polyprotein from transposon TNT 1-94-like beta-barrel domain-containing protein n=1 Tax=Saponaria officinalis TaxID=3572 RepID=A0AAW1JM21_SAPOF
MVDNMFDIYCKTKTAKGIWDALETKYESDDFGTKKYAVARWLKFEIFDGKPIMDQIHDYENLVFEIFGEGMMVLSECMQANDLIDKLPSPNCGCYKEQDHVRTNATNIVKANVVEYRNTGKNKRSYDQYNNPQANVVEGLSEGNDIIVVMVSEINLVGNLVEWIINTRATRHICTNKDLYKEFKDVDKKEVVYLGNYNEVSVTGIGKVHLKPTFGKVLTLDNMLYVPDMRRNLISSVLLNKVGLIFNFESDKLIMSKNGQLLAKGLDLTFDASSHEDNNGSSPPRVDTSSEPPLEPRRS